MKRRVRGLLIALLHVTIVCTLMGKFYYDRASRPRVWVRTAPVDPDLPIRGRYVALSIEVNPKLSSDVSGQYYQRGRLEVGDGRLYFVPEANGSVSLLSPPRRSETDRPQSRLYESLAFFIPEHVPDPSRRKPGEELWVEVTVPRQGPPRPIRLGVKEKDATEIRPLDLD